MYVCRNIYYITTSTYTHYTHTRTVHVESAVSFSSYVQHHRVLQLVGLISEVEKKKKKHPSILLSHAFFFPPATQPISCFLHFHMSHTGPRPGTNELTGPQLVPHCSFVCLCVRACVRETYVRIRTQTCAFCCICIYVCVSVCQHVCVLCVSPTINTHLSPYFDSPGSV